MSEPCACVTDVENHAVKLLPKSVLDFYRSGAGFEDSLKNNRKAFSRQVQYKKIDIDDCVKVWE